MLGARLISRIEEYYDIPCGSVCDERRRNGNISKARWAVSHVLVIDAGWVQPRVAKLMGKDHKAVAYGLKQAKLLLRQDPLFFEAVRILQEEISPHVGNPSI